MINALTTVEDRSGEWPVIGIGNDWSRSFYDGPFDVFTAPAERPAISLVFVQSRDGNTGADNPADLGGGDTDKCLLYEGLSRVAADAVLAGASSVGRHQFFTVTQPELVTLRLELGLPRHPTQMVLSNHGRVDLQARVFTTPDVPVLLLAGPECERKIGPQLRDRPWITLVPIGDSLEDAFMRVRREHHIGPISAIGGRVAATSLVDAGLVQDLYLTTSAIVWKREARQPSPSLFEHLALDLAPLSCKRQDH